MSSGKKPSAMKVSPRLASNQQIDEKLGELQVAESWAQVPAVEDALDSGLTLAQSTQVERSDDKVGDHLNEIAGTSLRSLTPKREKREVTHLLKLTSETNERLEKLIDQIPRASKQRLIILAIDEYLTRVERVIERRKAG